MKDLDRVSKLAERYTMETRIKACHLIFFTKGLSDAKSNFFLDKYIIDSLKNSIAISFYVLTSPVTEQSLKTDFVKLQNRLVSLINSFSKTSFRKKYLRENSDIFLDSSFAVSNSNLEYISSWQWIEFFEFFDNTIASLFKVEKSSNLVKYVIANELNPDISHESFEHGVLSRMTDEEVKTLVENSWTLQELTVEMRKVDSVQDAYNVLKKSCCQWYLIGDNYYILRDNTAVFKSQWSICFLHNRVSRSKESKRNLRIMLQMLLVKN